MFEQSILADPPKARKRSVLFLSFLAQIAICGVLLLIPLVYTDAITFAPQWSAPLLPPTPPPPPKFEVAQETRPTRSTARTFVRTDTLTAPPKIPTSIPVIDDAPPPADYVPTGIPGGAQIATARLPGFSSIPAPPDLPAPRSAPVVETPKPDPVPSTPVRISGGVQAAKLTKRVMPPYPTVASRARIQGTVRLRAIIGRDGRVRDLTIVEGHPFLRQAAVDAVRQWEYSPTILGTQPVEVETTIDVNFVLR